MQLHNIKPLHKSKKRKRVGRGGKRGTYSGRGQKGQKARAGRMPRTSTETILKMPKLRGTKNRQISSRPIVINVGDLKKIGSSLINKKVLLKQGFIKNRSEKVKILGSGETTEKFIIDGLEISKSAKEKIEKAGGRIEHEA